MKKRILAILILIVMMFSSCNNQPSAPVDGEKTTEPNHDTQASTTAPDTTMPTDTTADTEPVVSPGKIKKVGDIASYEGVTSFSRYNGVSGALNYDFTYLSDGLSIHGIISLPKDYLTKSYPVMLYFFEVGGNLLHERIADSFTPSGVITVSMYERGLGDSEGQRDFAGESLADAKYLLNMIGEFAFCDQNRIFVAGSSAGSVYALRLMAEDAEGVICAGAVVDPVTDFIYRYETANDAWKQYYEKDVFGGSPQEVPKKYEERSAYYFADQIKAPLLVLHYQGKGEELDQESRAFADKLKEVGADYSYTELPKLGSDFIGDAAKYLLSFIREQA